MVPAFHFLMVQFQSLGANPGFRRIRLGQEVLQAFRLPEPDLPNPLASQAFRSSQLLPVHRREYLPQTLEATQERYPPNRQLLLPFQGDKLPWQVQSSFVLQRVLLKKTGLQYLALILVMVPDPMCQLTNQEYRSSLHQWNPNRPTSPGYLLVLCHLLG